MRNLRLVRVFLRLYPPEFRARYGAEMRETYRAQRNALRGAGRTALLVLTARTVVGMVRGAVAEWRVARTRGKTGMATSAAERATTGWGGSTMGTMDVWRRELLQSARRLVRAPGFSLLSVVTLAVGTGAFAAVFTVVESVLLEPMPYESPEELAWVWREYPWMDAPRFPLGSQDVRYLSTQPGVEGMILAGSRRTTLAAIDGDDLQPRDVTVVTASHDFLETLGVRPLFGRGFRPEDGDPAAPAVVLLPHALWREAFAADPTVVARTVALAGVPARIVGVLPRGFDFLRHRNVGEPVQADLYAAFRTDLDAQPPAAAWIGGLFRFRGGPAISGRARCTRARGGTTPHGDHAG